MSDLSASETFSRDDGRLPAAGISATRALCNHCGRLTQAKVVIQDNRVFLDKWCPDHGRSRALIESDSRWYLQSQAFVKPGTDPLHRAINDYRGCPDSCGLCPEHRQHTCVPILEITDACDLNCPICLVSRRVNQHLSVEQVRFILERLIRYEGKLNMLNISGGEPTRHPDFLNIVDATLRPEFGIVSVSTNGITLAEDPDLIRALRDRGVVISLQFDGVREETYHRLRGRGDLASVKLRLIEKMLALGATFSLTMTLARGINESELPEALRLLFSHDQIVSMMVQPLSFHGEAEELPAPDFHEIITISDAVRLLAEASGGVLRESDFLPLPCSHPSCFALTYLLKSDNQCLVSLPSVMELEPYLDIIKNQALLNTNTDSLIQIKDALYSLWSASGQIPNREMVLKTIKQILMELNRIGPSAPHHEVLSLGARHVKSIFIHHFMDRFNFDLSRVIKCCNHYPQADGRLLPACVRNNPGCRSDFRKPWPQPS